jgi:hypothetical protein
VLEILPLVGVFHFLFRRLKCDNPLLVQCLPYPIEPPVLLLLLLLLLLNLTYSPLILMQVTLRERFKI